MTTLYPLLVTMLAAAALLSARTAAAAPRRSLSNAQEDALADGEIDPEDIAARSVFAPGASSGRTTLGAPSGSAWVSLVGFSRRTLDDRQETGGYVVVGLPFDRFASGSRRRTSREAPVGMAEADALEVRNVAHVDSGAAADSPFEIALSPRLARACVGAAWRAAGLGIDEARIDAIVSRARWSAMLPEARIRAVRFEDAQLSLDTSTDTSRLRDTAGANVGFEARLTWRFDRLLYADDEPAFERLRLEQRDARARVASRVLEALFHWQRAALDLRSLPPTQQGTRDEAEARLRFMEAEAALDVLTNGQFGSQVAAAAPRRSPEPYGAPVPVRMPAGRAGGDL